MVRQYRPSNGTEGACFIDYFCCKCWYDRNEDCPTLADAFAYDLGEEGYPAEWVQDEGGPRCTLFTTKEPKAFPVDDAAQLRLDIE